LYSLATTLKNTLYFLKDESKTRFEKESSQTSPNPSKLVLIAGIYELAKEIEGKVGEIHDNASLIQELEGGKAEDAYF
jgi:hypothetical protein